MSELALDMGVDGWLLYTDAAHVVLDSRSLKEWQGVKRETKKGGLRIHDAASPLAETERSSFAQSHFLHGFERHCSRAPLFKDLLTDANSELESASAPQRPSRVNPSTSWSTLQLVYGVT